MKYDWFWLCSIPGLYRSEKKKLLQHFGHPEDIRSASEGVILRLPYLKERQKQILLEHKKKFEAESEYHKCMQSGIQFISCRESAYPEKLKLIEDYPYGLFFKGNLPDPGKRSVAVVGARGCTNYGRSMASKLAAALAASEVQVVSGMAYGIDGCASASCLEAGGRSYAVLGGGVDICYPREHRALYQELSKSGGILSEYPPGMSPQPFHFPMRNRIISGLSDCVVVVEAKRKSGSLITADLALEQGRDVWAFPGRVGDTLSAGCNVLISQGAGIITGVEELLDSLGIRACEGVKKKNSNIVLASAEKLVYSCVDSQSRNLEQITEAAQLPVRETMSILTGLQIKGLIEETATNYYARK